MTKATLNPALKDFWMAPARYRVLYGGRSSSKSWDAAGFAVFLADNYKLRILCARQFQNKIEESVYSLLKIQIERFGLNHRFEILKNKIINKYTGTEFLFYGLWRNIDEVKSMESIDITWLEEAHNITREQWAIIRPTVMRKAHSQTWVIFNPRLSTDFAYKRFVVNPPPRTITRKINYTENPFLSDDMLVDIEDDKEADYEEYEHVYLGVPKDDDDASVIKRSWVMAAIDAHKAVGFEASGSKRLGFDVADAGEDACAQILAHGSVALWSDLWKGREDELLKSCTRVWHTARGRGASVTYDSIGVGAMAGAKLDELNSQRGSGAKVGHTKFNAGDAVWRPDSIYAHGTSNKDMFANLKAQAWWLVADRFRNTSNAVRDGQQFDEDQMISIDSGMPNLDQLIDELCTPKRDYDANGRVKVESKKDMARSTREGGAAPSPNLADAFIMAYAPGNKPMKIDPNLLRQA